ncbi:energy transducer TonB [Algoriphagus sp. AGSA1]|uniref:energy transducer TonB n=1 Tax=Algoriphagus sp. AGSA1 TaxID=2907213 RepID=UPI001F31A2B6|nr:energy transducer TonB [Algoriphagus sp. AGSA1]MCE7057352.1 energy transducer TonB [Algoriphagus sp. AGSA1]
MKNKVKIIDDVYLSPMEIEKLKDFESVLKKRNTVTVQRGYWRNSVVWLSVALISFSVIGILIFNTVYQASDVDSLSPESANYTAGGFLNKDEIVTSKDESSTLSQNSITSDFLAAQNKGLEDPLGRTKSDQIESKSDSFVSLRSYHQAISLPKRLLPDIDVPIEFSLLLPEEKTPASNIPFEDAHPIDGFENLYAWFASNITYPEEHRKDKIEGSVKVSFLVDKDSTISAVKVTQSLGVAFDREAVRLIEHMPKWAPATRGGIPISRTLVFPISFKVESR